ncbi:2-oxoglutarate synthase [bacterium]|nr:MAG: 2-oxoglutarate synthase [bacterium]
MNNPFPQCWRCSNKPHKFDPGCGHGITLKLLGEVIDEMGIADKTVLGWDIGCSLLAWDLFDIDAVQTHHGRTISVISGFKKSRPNSIAIAYVGDGGGYAIGLSHLLNSAQRDENISVLLINNANYGMTGGQEAPTTLPGQKTSTTPNGADELFMRGPELVRTANKNAFSARGTVRQPLVLKKMLREMIECQNNGHFAFLEVLSGCPVNWKTDANGTVAFLKEMEEYYPLGKVLRIKY